MLEEMLAMMISDYGYDDDDDDGVDVDDGDNE